jgi:hypothetical protein
LWQRFWQRPSAATLLHLRRWLVEGVPTSLRYSFAVGMGLFLTFIGLNETGIVRLGVAGAPVRPGQLNSAPVLVAMFGIVLLAVLVIRKVPGGILLSILATAVLAFAVKVAVAPHQLVSLPPSLRPTLWQLDFRGALTWRAFPVVLTIFIMAFFDTMGTLIGLSARAGFLNEEGHLPQIERPMLVDALSTCVAPALGTTTSGAYVESATGIEAGGRTGFTALVTGTCFLLTLFFAPVVAAIPAQAYGPALIIVGLFMLEPITRIDFGDFSESIPAFAVVTVVAFTFNIAIGICGPVCGRSPRYRCCSLSFIRTINLRADGHAATNKGIYPSNRQDSFRGEEQCEANDHYVVVDCMELRRASAAHAGCGTVAGARERATGNQERRPCLLHSRNPAIARRLRSHHRRRQIAMVRSGHGWS